MANRDGTLIAEVAQVTVDPSAGSIAVNQFWAAQDNGLTINPKAVQGQIESNIIQATSRTLKEQVQFDQSSVTSLDWRGVSDPDLP